MVDGGTGLFIKIETKFRFETQCTQHSNGIFPITIVRFTNEPYSICFDVVQAVDQVDNLSSIDVVVQGVHGKVTAICIFLNSTVDVVVKNPAVVCVSVLVYFFVGGTEGRDLNDVSAKSNMNNAKSPAYGTGVSENIANFFRVSVRCNIKILWGPSQYQISHTPPDKVCFKSMPGQALDNF